MISTIFSCLNSCQVKSTVLSLAGVLFLSLLFLAISIANSFHLVWNSSIGEDHLELMIVNFCQNTQNLLGWSPKFHQSPAVTNCFIIHENIE
jgi:hypothetical protein